MSLIYNILLWDNMYCNKLFFFFSAFKDALPKYFYLFYVWLRRFFLLNLFLYFLMCQTFMQIIMRYQSWSSQLYLSKILVCIVELLLGPFLESVCLVRVSEDTISFIVGRFALFRILRFLPYSSRVYSFFVCVCD